MRWLKRLRSVRLRRKLSEARHDLAMLRIEHAVMTRERDLLAGVVARDSLRVRLETQTFAQGIAETGKGSEP